MIDREEAQEIACQVLKLARDANEAVDEMKLPVAKIQVSSMERGWDAVSSSALGMQSSEAPYDRIIGIARGIVAGNVGWSAESTGGLRMAETMNDLMENGDYTYYLRHLIRNIDDEGVIDYEAEEVRDISRRIFRAEDGIREALEPLMGAYEA